MERGRGPLVDGVSRFLSTIAILAGLGGLGGSYFLYQENQSLKQDVAQLKDASVSQTDVEAFNEDWGSKLSTALGDFNQSLDAFKKDANEALKKDDVAREARDRVFNQVVAQLKVDRVAVEEIVSRQVGQKFTEFQALASAPRLRVAETRMRPSSEGDAQYVPIVNEGDSAAEIRSAIFKPKLNGQFRLKGPMKMDENSNRLVIEFSPHDNKAQTQGRHDDYVRTYLVPDKSITSNQTVNLTVEIQNSDHVNWGWQGALELEYGDGETLLVPNISAVFVASDPDSI